MARPMALEHLPMPRVGCAAQPEAEQDEWNQKRNAEGEARSWRVGGARPVLPLAESSGERSQLLRHLLRASRTLVRIVGEATMDQLFAVIQGAGRVSGEDEVMVPISAGQAAFWAADGNRDLDEHEARLCRALGRRLAAVTRRLA